MSQHTNSMFEFLAPGRGGRGGAAHHAAHAAAQEAARHHHAQQVSSPTRFLPLDFLLSISTMGSWTSDASRHT